MVYQACVDGICDCVFYVGGTRTQIRPCRVITKALLGDRPDPGWEYIVRGALYGFKVVNDSCPSEYMCYNYDFTPAERNLMSIKMRSELQKEYISVVDTPMSCVHALGCVPKGEGIRVVVDCSRPALTAVNNYTDEVSEKFHYKSVRDVTDMLMGGEVLCTLDISDAYRAIHTDPQSRSKQGLSWDFGKGPVHMRDNRLSMGLSSSPYCFNRISDFVVRVLHAEGVPRCVNYLDDFCIVSDTQEQGRVDQRCLMRLLRHLGFDISFKKLIDPSTYTRFLGIDIDTVNMCLFLPEDKMARLKATVVDYSHRISATKQELDELAGLLAHCSCVIKGGRTFTRRVYDLCASESHPHRQVKLTEEFREDITWWCGFADIFNGSAKIIGPSSPMIGLYSDSSFWGYGAYSNRDWVAGPWDETNKWAKRLGHHYAGTTEVVSEENINVLEMFPILQAAKRWGQEWRDRRICAVTDNTQVMWGLRKGRSKNSFSMEWIREIFWLSVEHNFIIDSVYISTDDNILCDSLSRLDDPESVAKIRDRMCEDSMCCYDIFTDC